MQCDLLYKLSLNLTHWSSQGQESIHHDMSDVNWGAVVCQMG